MGRAREGAEIGVEACRRLCPPDRVREKVIRPGSMQEPQRPPKSLFDALVGAGSPSECLLCAPDASVAFDALARGTSLGGALADLQGRPALVATARPLPAPLSLIPPPP